MKKTLSQQPTQDKKNLTKEVGYKSSTTIKPKSFSKSVFSSVEKTSESSSIMDAQKPRSVSSSDISKQSQSPQRTNTLGTRPLPQIPTKKSSSTPHVGTPTNNSSTSPDITKKTSVDSKAILHISELKIANLGSEQFSSLKKPESYGGDTTKIVRSLTQHSLAKQLNIKSEESYESTVQIFVQTVKSNLNISHSTRVKTIKELLKSIEEREMALEQLSKLPIQKLSEDLARLTTNLNTLANETQIEIAMVSSLNKRSQQQLQNKEKLIKEREKLYLILQTKVEFHNKLIGNVELTFSQDPSKKEEEATKIIDDIEQKELTTVDRQLQENIDSALEVLDTLNTFGLTLDLSIPEPTEIPSEEQLKSIINEVKCGRVTNTLILSIESHLNKIANQLATKLSQVMHTYNNKLNLLTTQKETITKYKDYEAITMEVRKIETQVNHTRQSIINVEAKILIFYIRINNLDNFKKCVFSNYGLNGQDVTGQTPLHVAVRSGEVDFINVLLENKVNVNVYDNNGRSPLHLAVLHHQPIEIVKCLITNPNDKNKNVHVSVHARDSAGKTASDYSDSATKQDRSELQAVLQHGENLSKQIFNIVISSVTAETLRTFDNMFSFTKDINKKTVAQKNEYIHSQKDLILANINNTVLAPVESQSLQHFVDVLFKQILDSTKSLSTLSPMFNACAVKFISKISSEIKAEITVSDLRDKVWSAVCNYIYALFYYHYKALEEFPLALPETNYEVTRLAFSFPVDGEPVLLNFKNNINTSIVTCRLPISKQEELFKIMAANLKDIDVIFANKGTIVQRHTTNSDRVKKQVTSNQQQPKETPKFPQQRKKSNTFTSLREAFNTRTSPTQKKHSSEVHTVSTSEGFFGLSNKK